MNFLPLSITVLLSCTLIACGGGGGSSSGNTRTSSGQLTVDVSDGPVESASEVVVAFSAIEIKPAEGNSSTVEFDEVQLINLLDYQGEAAFTLLNDYSLDAGEYNWIRLLIDDAQTYIVVNDSQHELEIPSGSQSGLKLNNGFTIASGGDTHITLDFELRRSIHQTGNGRYMMKPVIRMVDNSNTETLSGVVADSLVEDPACNNEPNSSVGNAVYLFSGHDSSVQDIQENDNDPLSSATVAFDDEDERYEFSLGFVPLGDYTIVFTCDAILDDPSEANGDVSFSEPFNVTIVDDQENFVALD